MDLFTFVKQAAAAAPAKPPRPELAPAPAPPGAGEPPLKGNALTNAANALAKYIPKEIVTLYVAGLAAGPALKLVAGFGSRTLLYWVFVGLTPCFYIGVYLAFLKANDKEIPPFREWPWGPTLASVFAFGVWALAVPGNPYVSGSSQSAAAGFCALFVSAILGIADPWLDPKPK